MFSLSYLILRVDQGTREGGVRSGGERALINGDRTFYDPLSSFTARNAPRWRKGRRERAGV